MVSASFFVLQVKKEAGLHASFGLSKSEKYKEYQISEQSDNNGWKGRKCLNTNSQKFCKKSFLRIHCQIDSGCHSKRNGE